jgi:serralysin
MAILTGNANTNIIIGTTDDDNISGFGGNDFLFSASGNDSVFGDNGNDFISTGAGDDFLEGGSGVDRLTSGEGNDIFFFSDDPFVGNTANLPDVLTDFQIGQDRLFFSSDKLGVNNLNFQTGISSQLSGDSNLIILQDGFANAGAAAQAIADNNAITADAGLFVYFNTTLGFSRVVFSTDLSDRGQFSVLGNLINQTDVANQTQFTNNEFVLV